MRTREFKRRNMIADFAECEIFQKLIETKGNGKTLSEFYLIKDPIYVKRLNLPVDPTSPYLERFQGN